MIRTQVVSTLAADLSKWKLLTLLIPSTIKVNTYLKIHHLKMFIWFFNLFTSVLWLPRKKWEIDSYPVSSAEALKQQTGTGKTNIYEVSKICCQIWSWSCKLFSFLILTNFSAKCQIFYNISKVVQEVDHKNAPINCFYDYEISVKCSIYSGNVISTQENCVEGGV